MYALVAVVVALLVTFVVVVVMVYLPKVMYALVVVFSIWQALSLLRDHYSPIGARSNPKDVCRCGNAIIERFELFL